MLGQGTFLLKWTGALLLGGALVLSSGCRGKHLFFWPSSTPAADTEAASPAGQATTTDEQSATGRDPSTEGYREASTQTEERPLGRQVPELPPVLFGFDRYDLDPEAREILRAHAGYMRANPEIRVILRGHTDASGTEEYNLVLGQRRAQAVRDHLIDLGIAPDRLETVSFGKGVPIVEGDSAEAHAQNRRVEFFLFEL